MTLQEIFNKAIAEDGLTVPCDIVYRFTIPQEGIYDEFSGACHWDGNELTSLDGDSYDLNDEFIGYFVSEDDDGSRYLTVIQLADTLTDADIEEYRKTHLDINPESETEKELHDYMVQEEPSDAPETRTRAERRKNDYHKAVRKRKIAKAVYPSGTDKNWEWYSNLHQYSKGKIHCSCPMCSEKTNGKENKRGKVSEFTYVGKDGEEHAFANTPHYGTTNNRMGDNFSRSERRRVESMREQLNEFNNGELAETTQGDDGDES